MDSTIVSCLLILTVSLLLVLLMTRWLSTGSYIANSLKDFHFKPRFIPKNPITKMNETAPTSTTSGPIMERTPVSHWKFQIDKILNLSVLLASITNLTWRCKTRFYTWSYVVCATIARKATRLQIKYGAKSSYYSTLLIKSSAANLMLRRNR